MCNIMGAVMRYGWTICGILLTTAPGLAQEAPQIRQFDVATIETLGRAIYRQDLEAARASDLLMAAHGMAELQQEKIRGWIVDQKPEGDLVRFVRGEGDLEAAYDVSFAPGASGLSVPHDRTLTAEEKGQFAARTLASRNIDRPCTRTYNTVILHDPQGDGWLVWALAASDVPRTWFIGGNYRFTISKDGGSILHKDALSRGCLTMTQDAAVPKGAQPVAQVSSQLVSPIPVETAVFVNLASGMPMFVATPDSAVWQIVDGHMSKLDPSRLGPAPK